MVFAAVVSVHPEVSTVAVAYCYTQHSHPPTTAHQGSTGTDGGSSLPSLTAGSRFVMEDFAVLGTAC